MYTIYYDVVGSLNEISDLRNEYLDGLIESQELFLELQIRKGKVTVIRADSDPIGYFITGMGDLLLEYHLTHPWVNSIDSIFKEIVTKFSIPKAFCKSFDHNLLSCCATIQKQTKVIGVLFREYEKKPIMVDEKEITFRLAKENDFDHIAAINEAVFDTNDEIAETIANRNMFIFENNTDVIGFGIFQRVIDDRPDFDLGLLVDANYRGQSIGCYIIQNLADYCIKNGWWGTCGCAIENTASRRCLEKAGFSSRYRMLEFLF
jgi:L-amino acid N-acyltransferase YncA